MTTAKGREIALAPVIADWSCCKCGKRGTAVALRGHVIAECVQRSHQARNRGWAHRPTFICDSQSVTWVERNG